MLATAIALFFTFAGIIALAVIADTLLKVRLAHARLLREGEVLRAGLALQAAAVEMALRLAPRRVTAARRVPALRPSLPRACAAA